MTLDLDYVRVQTSTGISNGKLHLAGLKGIGANRKPPEQGESVISACGATRGGGTVAGGLQPLDSAVQQKLCGNCMRMVNPMLNLSSGVWLPTALKKARVPLYLKVGPRFPNLGLNSLSLAFIPVVSSERKSCLVLQVGSQRVTVSHGTIKKMNDWVSYLHGLYHTEDDPGGFPDRLNFAVSSRIGAEMDLSGLTQPERKSRVFVEILIQYVANELSA